ncbi:MAG: hypothetical protein HZA29_02980 [Candidatus Omnitrophica bacterium]|nr:hypothetical protein [Candidatus Omnitrophota bacterium]
MSLKEFHLVFVGAAILCSIFYGYWAAQQYAHNAGPGYLTTALGAFCVAGALVIYEIIFSRKMKG